jgi:hypothetical protein
MIRCSLSKTVSHFSGNNSWVWCLRDQTIKGKLKYTRNIMTLCPLLIPNRLSWDRSRACSVRSFLSPEQWRGKDLNWTNQTLWGQLQNKCPLKLHVSEVVRSETWHKLTLYIVLKIIYNKTQCSSEKKHLTRLFKPRNSLAWNTACGMFRVTDCVCLNLCLYSKEHKTPTKTTVHTNKK